MNYYDEQLKQLQSDMATKRRLEAMLEELHKQYDELSAKVQVLEKKKKEELADVAQLEGRSLSAFFYQVIGKRDDKLTKEKQEAYEASVKYDVAYREFMAVQEDIRFREKEQERVANSEVQYRAVMKAKQEAVKEAGIPEAMEILKLEEGIAELETQRKETEEAVLAGQKAKQITESMQKSLSDAENWGTWDMFGGGLLADVMKHGSLDEAQARVEDLQEALRCFKTELADIEIQADMQVTIEGFLSFADYFFDGLFVDWAVMDHIHESQKQVQNTLEQIESVLEKLSTMKESIEKELADASGKLEKIVKGTVL